MKLPYMKTYVPCINKDIDYKRMYSIYNLKSSNILILTNNN